MVSGLQETPDKLEGGGSDVSNLPPLGFGSDDSWGPGSGPGRPPAHGGPRRTHPSASAPSHSSARRGDWMISGRDHSGERDQWLSKEYCSRRVPVRITDVPRRPERAPEPAQPWYGQ